MLSTRSALRSYKKKRTGAPSQLSSAREAVKRRRYSSVVNCQLSSAWEAVKRWRYSSVVNCQLSSAWEAVKVEYEGVKLKNLHCYKSLLQGNG
jgi:hypothetical protein